IRARIPHASIGSDIIVGFPGETDDDFGEVSSYLASSPLTHVHVFPTPTGQGPTPRLAATRCMELSFGNAPAQSVRLARGWPRRSVRHRSAPCTGASRSRMDLLSSRGII